MRSIDDETLPLLGAGQQYQHAGKKNILEVGRGILYSL